MAAKGMGPRVAPLWLAVLLLLHGHVSARTDDLVITVSHSEPWVYLGKFGFATGNASTVRRHSRETITPVRRCLSASLPPCRCRCLWPRAAGLSLAAAARRRSKAMSPTSALRTA